MTTVGQKRALRELERLQAVSSGAFDFSSEDAELGDWLGVQVSIRIGPIAKAEGGLDFHERESFMLLIPPNFPFTRPSVFVPHTRFSGFPHVIWANTLCLYQSSIEWNPANGLFGFFERLNLWIGRAALNEMDPIEGPLEPPHHITDSSQVPFVIRANAPVEAGQRWMGVALLKTHSNRKELLEWRESVSDLPDGLVPAFTMVFPQPLPMEFPKTGKDIFPHFTNQGFEPSQILKCLALATLLTPRGEPSYLIVGLPMRRGADGSLKLHIAIWSIKSHIADALRVTFPDKADTEETAQLRVEVLTSVTEWFMAAEISWCRVMEDRPEIVVRRDARSPLAWFLDKRVLVLGCGALGSWAAEMIARAGAASIDLVDNGIVKPGLLSRQNFISDDIGSKKAEALSKRLVSITKPGFAANAFDKDAHAFATEDITRFRSYDLVIDCTASHIVQMQLERDWKAFEGRTPPLISMITSATASHGLCVVLRENSLGGPWDAYVHMKHELCNEGLRKDIINAFYVRDIPKQLFQPEPGCSDLTFIGSTADASSVVSIALNLASLQALVKKRGSAFAFTAADSGRPDVTAPEMEEYVAGHYRVRISKKVGREAYAWVRQNNRLRSSAHETGGLLWGMWDDAIGVIWVFDASGPPVDSRHDPGHFVCGTEGTREEHARRSTSSHYTSGFIGYWHTHPDMPSYQSGTDIHGMASLVSAVGENQKRALMLIFGRTGAKPTMGIYVYESHDLIQGGDSVEIGSAQVTLATPIV